MYPSSAIEAKRVGPIITVHYRPALNRLKEMAEHETIKKKDEGVLERDWSEDS